MTFDDDLNMILEEAGGHISYCSDDGADEKLAIVATFKERCVDKQRVREAFSKHHNPFKEKNETLMKIYKELDL